MYINDLPNKIKHCTTYFFAGDAKYIKVINQPLDCTSMQIDLTSFSKKWSDKWKLLLNSNKCCAIRFSSYVATPNHMYLLNQKVSTPKPYFSE